MEMSDLNPTPQELLLKAIFNAMSELPCPVLWSLPDPNSDVEKPEYPFIVLSTTTNQPGPLYKNARVADIDVYIDIFAEKGTRTPVERLTYAARAITETISGFNFIHEPQYDSSITTDTSTEKELYHGQVIANYQIVEKEW